MERGVERKRKRRESEREREGGRERERESSLELRQSFNNQSLPCRICDLTGDSLHSCKSYRIDDRDFKVGESVVCNVQFFGQTSEKKIFQVRFDLHRKRHTLSSRPRRHVSYLHS